MNEPISDTVRGIIDGHIVLDRELANKGQYPAINVLKSVSRVMNHIVSERHKEAAEKLRSLMATYANSEDLINIGAYKRGSSAYIDEAIHYHPVIDAFLKQKTNEHPSFETSVTKLCELFVKGE
jgi:flagellum-specific ATP synthase